MSEEQLNLSKLSPAPGSKQRRKRLGHGSGSGLGKTCGRGHKGQGARSGAGIPAGFEGGQMPLHRRLPKRGFTSRKRLRGENVYSLISLERLAQLGEDTITVEVLLEKGVVRGGKSKVKVLGGASVEKALTLEVDAISASAKAAVEQAGGTVRLRG